MIRVVVLLVPLFAGAAPAPIVGTSTRPATTAVPAGAERVAPEARDPAIPARRSGYVFLGPEDGRREPAWRGEPISLSLKGADLRDVLQSFAKLGRFNLILDPSVRGEVTLELENVPWDQALYVILKVHSLGAEVDGTIVAIGR